MALRKEKKRTINGKVYERAGQHPSKSKATLESWANFQRNVNGIDAVIVHERGGYECYIRKGLPETPARTVTIREVEPTPKKARTPRKPHMAKVRVPDADIIGSGRRRHLRLY
jgi:hypothetical protein